jgi:hypothetical protein
MPFAAAPRFARSKPRSGRIEEVHGRGLAVDECSPNPHDVAEATRDVFPSTSGRIARRLVALVGEEPRLLPRADVAEEAKPPVLDTVIGWIGASP